MYGPVSAAGANIVAFESSSWEDTDDPFKCESIGVDSRRQLYIRSHLKARRPFERRPLGYLLFPIIGKCDRTLNLH